MNIHPLFIHFPIAFLTLYSVLELLHWVPWFRSEQPWFAVRAVLIITGIAGAYVALETGEMAAEVFAGAESEVLEMHEQMAEVTTYIFLALALSYVFACMDKTQTGAALAVRWSKIWTVLRKIDAILRKSFLTYLLVFAGFATLTLTGALGALMVYGPEIDPVVGYLYNVLFK